LEPLLGFRLGSFDRFTLAISSSSFSDMDSYMLREAPLSFDFEVSPRFAAKAAPAAFCWALDLAGMMVPPDSYTRDERTRRPAGSRYRLSSAPVAEQIRRPAHYEKNNRK
jgi:hypothetical protein